MVDTPRARRLAKRIVTIVATELEHQVKDPRLAMVTVTAATVTPDLREAVVYYTVYGDDDDQQSSAMALASALGVLRSAVGKQTGIKFTPTLEFRPDKVPETSQQIEALLAAARAADAEVAQQAAGAVYAGEADPYRVPREDEDAADDGDDPADLGDAADPAAPADAAVADAAVAARADGGRVDHDEPGNDDDLERARGTAER
ncbi:MAG: 30S ribosome-binding factor RbfA [Nakamurella sp.]